MKSLQSTTLGKGDDKSLPIIPGTYPAHVSDVNGKDWNESFVYNLGSVRMKSSTLRSLLNRIAPREQVADEFPKWRRAAGKILQGLVRRRAAERALFLYDG